MNWTRANIGTLSLIAFALAAFLTELAGALPGGVGADLAQAALVAMAIGRGLVHAAQALSPYHDSNSGDA
jgi:hypothetical protein